MREATGNLYEALISQPPVPGASAGVLGLGTVRASASVVPWREDGGGLEVFWVRRSPQLEFMGGWRAFPGGGLSPEDAAVQVAGMPAGLVETPTEAGSPDPGEDRDPGFVPGLTVCALRELFEETGLLPAVPASGNGGTAAALDPGAAAAARRRLLAGEVGFERLLAELGLRPDASGLVFAGRWRTPPGSPIRFDNRFFLLEWSRSAAVQPRVVPGELASGDWIEPARALEAWKAGDVLAAPPILHVLRVLDEEGPVAGLERLRFPNEANLGPFRRLEVRPGVILLPLEVPTLPPATHTNCYLLGSDEVVVVDPGSGLPHQVEALKLALTEAQARHGKRFRAIWLTHHHPDHVGGVEEIRRFLEVPVAAHPLTARRLAGSGIAVDEELIEGQRVVLGSRPPFPVRVLHTPGHAQGHLCFYDETHGSLLAGDLVAGVGTIVVDPPEGDMEAYLGSLERMAELGPRALFPAHGPVLADAVAHLRGYIRHRLWREEKILEAWDAGHRGTAELVAAAYDDVPPLAHPLAARQLAAHLDRLRGRGRL